MPEGKRLETIDKSSTLTTPSLVRSARMSKPGCPFRLPNAARTIAMSAQFTCPSKLTSPCNAVATKPTTVDSLATPVKVAVEHKYDVRLVEPGHAIVVDSYVNHSVFVDPKSGESTEPDPNEKLLETYTVRSLEGSWMVVGITRQ